MESTQPPYTRKEKWVLIISTLFGCPVACKFCDAGGDYQGKLSYKEIMFQIDFLLQHRFQSRNIDTEKFKIQFARMGEPAFNEHVLTVLKTIQHKYTFKNFIPSISTIGPAGHDSFFQHLLEIRKAQYPRNFQLQFSLHSTDNKYRDYLIPIKKWDFSEISAYGRKFYHKDSQKIALNFALTTKAVVEPQVLLKYFNPDIYIIKFTPVNPTFQALSHRIHSYIQPNQTEFGLVEQVREAGYDVIVSIGEWEENNIGSNCGQYITAIQKKDISLPNSYTYPLEKV